MNIFFTQLRRRIALFGLLAILLAAVVASQAISLSSLAAVRKQINAVSGQYTTIAVPVEGTYWKSIFDREDSGAYVSLLEEKTEIPRLLAEDCRAVLNARVSGCESVSCFEKGYFSNDAYDMFNRNMAVLAVRCTKATEYEWERTLSLPDDNTETAENEECVQRDFVAEFSLESVLCQFPSYANTLPPIAEILTGGPYPTDGKMPFEEGKTYLLFGCFFADHKVVTGFDEDGNFTYDFSNPESWYFNLISPISAGNSGGPSDGTRCFDFLRSSELFKGDDGVYYERMSEGTLPYSAEYEGGIAEFLSSDNGKLWRDTLIPLCQTNYESANLVLTDNLESILWFNSGDAAVFDGRGFEPTDYANGKNVCLVSAAYALKNGLSVGDTLELDLYRSQIGKMVVVAGDVQPTSVNCNVYEPCKEENRLNIKKDYQIVGIYSAPEFATGEHAFSANTIFAPKTSVPNAERYENIEHSLLYSAILENGSSDAFEAMLEERDCGGMFAYFDQNYNMLAETLDVMEGNAVRMVLISSALFVLVAALFFFLFLRQTADPARKLRLLGVRAGTVRWQRYGAAAILILVAAVLGAAGGAGLYGAATKRVLSGNIALQPTALLLAVAAQTVILLIAALLCTLATARQNLVQKK